jgi:hypothetical protein
MTDEPDRDDLACTEEVEIMTEYLEQMRTVAGSLAGLTEGSIPAEMRASLLAAYRDLRRDP